MSVFISHAGQDRHWAEWVAWHLTDAGHQVELDVWDWTAGDDFVARMNEALARAERTVALWSAAFFEPQRFTTYEWAAAVASGRSWVPLRVEPVQPPPILSAVVYHDLFGVSEDEARRVLLAAVAGPHRPTLSPRFPGFGPAGGPRFPGSLPPVWNVAPRSALFSGRSEFLAGLGDTVRAAASPVVLHGLGGAGKTQLAVEFAHRNADDYDLVWWVSCERPALIGEQIAGLAVAASLVDAGTEIATATEAVWSWLRGHDRWLMVFDNAPGAEDVAAWLPQGPGQVLITSRSSAWSGVARTVPVAMFTRSESLALLGASVPGLDDSAADRLAAALGDMPLALAQAVGLMAETGMGAPEYVAALTAQAGDILAAGAPVGYPASLGASIQLAIAGLAEHPDAVELCRLCALVGPEPIPLWLFTEVEQLPGALGGAARDLLRLRHTIGLAARYGLLQATADTVMMHRLTQAVIRDGLTDDERASVRQSVEEFLVDAVSDDVTDPATWPRWSQVLPHVLATDPAATTYRPMMGLADRAVSYLYVRGDFAVAEPIGQRLYEQWRDRFGPDDDDVLSAAVTLANINRSLGRYQQAARLNEEVLASRRRVDDNDVAIAWTSAMLALDLYRQGDRDRAMKLADEANALVAGAAADDAIVQALAVTLAGLTSSRPVDETDLAAVRAEYGPDHLFALGAALGCAIGLYGRRELDRAVEVAEDALTRFHRVLGPDHPDTLQCEIVVGMVRSDLGRHGSARELFADALARRRAVLGPDHPDTLMAAHLLGVELHLDGEPGPAVDQLEEVLAGRVRVLGPDHPDTLTTAHLIMLASIELGRPQRAVEVGEDALARRRQVRGPDDPETLVTAHNLAIALFRLGRYDEARALDEDVLARRRQVLGPDHPHTLDTAFNLAIDLRLAQQNEAARELDDDTWRRRVRTQGPDHPSSLASAYGLAVDQFRLGHHDEALELFEDTLRRRREVLGADHPDTLGTAADCAAALRERRHFDRAADLDRDTLDRRRRLLGPDSDTALGSAVNLALDLRQLGRHAEAAELSDDVLARYRRLRGDDDPVTLAAAHLATVDRFQAGPEEAAAELGEDTLARRQRVLGPDHPDTLWTAYLVAVMLRGLGRPERARDIGVDTLERRRRVLGEDHPETLRTAHELAVDLYNVGEIEAARELDEDVLARRRRVLGPDDSSTLDTAVNLGVDLRQLDRFEAAREVDADALERHRRVSGPDHPATLAAARNLAADLRSLGRYQEAVEVAVSTLDGFRRVNGPDHPSTMEFVAALAADLRQLGRYGEARPLDEDILARRRRLLGDDHPDTGAAFRNLAFDLRKLRRFGALLRLIRTGPTPRERPPA